MFHSFNKSMTRRVALPAILALLIVAVAIAALLSWSAGRTNQITRNWQLELASGFVDNMGAGLGVVTESKARWDEALLKTHQPVLDLHWLDTVYGPFSGIWHVHFESYLIDSNDRPYYAADAESRRNPARFAARAGAVIPLVTELRKKMLKPNANIDYDQWKTPGIADIRNIDGEPVMVVLKPIVSDTGRIVQKPGTEHIYAYLYWLDQTTLEKWSKIYHLNGVRFSWTGQHGSHEVARPILSSRTKLPAGYFVWQPYEPGSIVLGDMVFPLLGGLLVISLVTWSLIRKVVRSTQQLQASEAQARHLAFHDTLTGLPNRALFDDRLDRALAMSRRRSDHEFALLFLDLDRFKQVNDTLGHPAGDELIREVGRRLTGLIREQDTVARLGGDEFAIILHHMRSEREIDSFCERVQAALNAPFTLIGSQAYIGVSIGIARAPGDSTDRSELTRKADIALYHAKAEGRRCHVSFSETLDTTIQFRRRIERDLREALSAKDQLEVYYQPQYDAASMKLKGVEGLVRWNHPELGLLSPPTFVPIAEESGLIESLGEWVLREACVAGRDWPDLIVSVNVSAVQLRKPRFAERVIEIAAETQFDLGRLELEITETTLLENLAQCEAHLVALRAKGVRIALDDFGTGYSSLSHLRSFRIDRVKIDRSFIRGLEDSTGTAIVQAIVHLAQSTGLKITAEGVETAAQTEFLCSVGCDELQGFGLSSPLPLVGFQQLYRLSHSAKGNRQLTA